MKTIKAIELKNEVCIPENTEVSIRFLGQENPRLVEITPIEGVPFKLKITSLNRYFKGYKIPSMATIEKWNKNGICKTVTGKKTEPDGYGSDDSPSWLLAMGLI
jgi:hypothetical protein